MAMLPLHPIKMSGESGGTMRRMVDRTVVAALLRRPLLLIEALRAAAALAPAGWWRRPPFLPIPDRRYLAWRRQTAYGTSEARLTPHDVVSYLEWRRGRRRRG